ncbi:MAG: large subunit ribosomal protein L24 [Planctomycetota bacterium]|jgi:large subunit ribosomal protein L24
MKFKTGETVKVITGNDRGRSGAVRQILKKTNRVIVEGVNLRWKHRKPTQQQPQGERIQEECSIHISNVMAIDAATGKTTRKTMKARA